MRPSSLLRDIPLRAFFSNKSANVALLFGVAAIPVAAAAGLALDYARMQNQSTRLRAAVDAAALGLVATVSGLTDADRNAKVRAVVEGNLSNLGPGNLAVSSTYDATSKILAVQASGSIDTTLMKIFGQTTSAVSETASATLGRGILPVCVLVTAPYSEHTLYAAGTAKISFDACMVQVNTAHWDAVEAGNTASIASTNGENCFVGSIHFGDVTPEKNPSCTFFTDPLKSLPIPSRFGTCSKEDLTITADGTALSPGTYCGNTTIKASNVTLMPGIYIIKDGHFSITGSGTVTAAGVSFLMTGKNPTFSIGGSAKVTQTPAASGVAGMNGIAIYLDPNATLSSCSPKDGPGADPGVRMPGATGEKSGGNGAGLLKYGWPRQCVSGVYANASYSTSGVIYLAGMAFRADDNAQVTINAGSLVAEYVAAGKSSRIALSGAGETSSSAALVMRKASEATGSQPRLLQ